MAELCRLLVDVFKTTVTAKAKKIGIKPPYKCKMLMRATQRSKLVALRSG